VSCRCYARLPGQACFPSYQKKFRGAATTAGKRRDGRGQRTQSYPDCAQSSALPIIENLNPTTGFLSTSQIASEPRKKTSPTSIDLQFSTEPPISPPQTRCSRGQPFRKAPSLRFQSRPEQLRAQGAWRQLLLQPAQAFIKRPTPLASRPPLPIRKVRRRLLL
jgi:hypothetical protein